MPSIYFLLGILLRWPRDVKKAQTLIITKTFFFDLDSVGKSWHPFQIFTAIWVSIREIHFPQLSVLLTLPNLK